MANDQSRALIGWSAPMDVLRDEIRNTGPTDMTVMLLGERGSGKEVVAREIHEEPSRQWTVHSIELFGAAGNVGRKRIVRLRERRLYRSGVSSRAI
jgi:hypothetical protein